MTTEGWIFMVGFRVIDVGALIVFLVWFFRQRFDADDPPEDDGPGGGGRGPDRDRGPSGGGLGLPLDRVQSGRRRLRSHSGRDGAVRRRGGEPIPRPQPTRVRRPRSPVPAHRRP